MVLRKGFPNVLTVPSDVEGCNPQSNSYRPVWDHRPINNLGNEIICHHEQVYPGDRAAMGREVALD